MAKNQETEKADPLRPSAGVLVALGSLAVHVEELLATPSVHKGKSIADAIEALSHSADFDLAAIRQNLGQVKEWLASMDALAFLPKKRH